MQPFLSEHESLESNIEDVVLSQESGNYGVDIPKGVWHRVEALESGSVIFECKEGPFSRLASSNERPEVERVPHEVEGILKLQELRK